jgi:hypothetical protein
MDLNESIVQAMEIKLPKGERPGKTAGVQSLIEDRIVFNAFPEERGN